MLYFNILIIVFLFSFLTILIWNLFLIKKGINISCKLYEHPLVSILVPMRNEEKNAEKCIKSLLSLEYSKYEIIVLNDDSEDNTGEILKKFSNNNKIKIIENHSLPEGWIGKNYACKILSDHASGNYLLFTDADTVHHPQSLKKIVEYSKLTNADLLSVIPRQEMISLSEKLLVPLLYFVLFVFLPMFMLKYNRFPKFSASIGQYLLFKRSAYDKIGGHLSVKSSIIEDIHLARKIKENNLKLRLLDGVDLISCRMYSSMKDIIIGFSKNISSGIGNSFKILIIMCLVNLLLFVYPFVGIIIYFLYQIFDSTIFYLLLIQIFIIYIMRLLLYIRFKQSFFSIFLHPIGILIMLILATRSFYLTVFYGKTNWKNRNYKIK